MIPFKKNHVFEAPECYAQYWHSNVTFDKKSRSFIVDYTTTTPSDHQYRSVFSSDRDRIMYSSCFLRLSAKTQIFTAGNNDHLRTRLTHTLEVSQIARTIAAELGLNQELTEAIALGHDVGHTPFGHAGERQLNEISQNQLKYIKISNSQYNSSSVQNTKGFKHNHQSLRVLVDFSHGISLTNFCLYGIRNHSSLLYKKSSSPDSMSFYNRYNKYCSFETKDKKELYPSWSWEAWVVYWADEIAQRHHDIEDAYRSKIISKQEIIVFLEELQSAYFKNDNNTYYSISEYNEYCQKAAFDTKFNALKSCTKNDETFNRRLSSFVVDFYSSALIKELLYCMRKISDKYRIVYHKDFVRKYLKIKESDISNILKLDDSSPFVIADKKFKTSLQKIIMPSYNVQRQDSKGQFITRKLLNAYITNPHQLPDQYLLRIFKVEIPRTLEPDQLNTLFEQLNHTLQRNFLLWDAIDARIAINTISQSKSGYELLYPLLFRTIFDYISGMTDSFAQEEYRRLY